jgi:hypothetical protein
VTSVSSFKKKLEGYRKIRTHKTQMKKYIRLEVTEMETKKEISESKSWT